MNVNYILEIPITSKDARRRRLPQEISKLITSFEGQNKQEQDKAMRFFSKVLAVLQNSHQKFHAQPVGSYLHLDKYVNELKENHISYWFDKKYQETKKRKPILLTVQCDTEDKIRTVFRMFRSDAVVFFLAAEYLPGGQLEATLLKRRFGTGYDEYYLKEIDSYPLFVLFENTHLSLEFLGRRDQIMRAFTTALDVEREHKLTDKTESQGSDSDLVI
ncbi:MAG: hypothetical protein HY203_00455 [Nitrospirae bacterium]|nr:hypothetical protein [Nitrospirota bacterium]